MEWRYVLAILLPIVFTIIVGIFYNNRRIDDINHRIDDLRSGFDKGFDENNKRLADLREDIREIRTMITQSLREEAGVE